MTLLILEVFFYSRFFGAVSSKIDDVLSMNPSFNVSIFVDFDVHDKHNKTLMFMISMIRL